MCPRACTPRERKCLRKRLRQEGGGRRRWSGSGSGGRREAGRRRGVSHRESGARRADFFPSSPHPPTRPPPLRRHPLPVIGHARIRVLRSKRRPASAFSSPSPCRLWQADDRDGEHRRLERCHFCGGDTSARKLLRGRRVNSMVSVMVSPHDPRYLANRSTRRLLISLLPLPSGGLPAEGVTRRCNSPLRALRCREHATRSLPVAPASSSSSSPFEGRGAAARWRVMNYIGRI